MSDVAEAAEPGADSLKLKFLGSLVEQIGAQMYPNVTATVAELVSNAWDADATNVWVSIPLGESWGPTSEIVVIDDGHGMTRADAQQKYLHVGRKKRILEKKDVTDGGRKVHGRKGIGKLAAFGTAKILECTTVRDGLETRFKLNYDNIRALPAGYDYEVEAADDLAPLVNPKRPCRWPAGLAFGSHSWSASSRSFASDSSLPWRGALPCLATRCVCSSMASS